MLGLMIELRTTCQRCGNPLPINAVADRIICKSCNHPTEIDDELWVTLLEDAFAEHASFEENEGQSSTMMTGGGTWEITYGRQKPRCGVCKTTVPDQALAFADRGWAICVECGKRFGIRPAPPVIARFGAVAMVNEDPAQLTTAATGEALAMPAAANPIVFSCPRCSGALTVDGSTRLVRCQYCSSDVYLPDDLWQRLHPVAVVSRWYAWFAEDLEQRKRSAFRWSSILDVVIGTDQLLYGLGTDDDMDEHVVVWCMSFDLQLRWLRDDVDVTAGFGGAANLAVDSGGRLFVWASEQPAAVVLACADGATLGRLGAPEPAGAKAHGFDLREGRQLHADIDGTLLALIDERLVRYAPDGGPLATWPPRSGVFGAKAEKLRPLYADGSIHSLGNPSVEEVKNHPSDSRDPRSSRSDRRAGSTLRTRTTWPASIALGS